MPRTSLILNPAAGRGRGNRLLPELRRRFSRAPDTEIAVTRAAGDEETAAEQALSRGSDTVVVAGGDGTCARVARVILASRSPCRLAIVPCGTGNDFAKMLGVLDLPPGRIADLVEAGIATRVDVGRTNEHYFLNSCGFGFDASVLAATQRVRFLKGNAVYILAALRQLLAYQAVNVAVRTSAGSRSRKLLMLTVSNGGFLGGAFRIAPDASILDGQLDVTSFGDGNIRARIEIFARAFRGTHAALPSVLTERASAMRFEFPEPPMMEVDGELRRAGSSVVEIECLPQALSVIAAPGWPR